MQLIPISPETIRIGHPLPFPLMDKDGVLLARKSFVIQSKQDLLDICGRGGGLFIDITDSQEHHRAYVERLHGMVNDGKSLGAIADAKIESVTLNGRADEDDKDHPDWLDLQVQGNSLLRATPPEQFIERLERLNRRLNRLSQHNPDGTLMALTYLAGSDTAMYSATHAMLVSVLCSITAREVLGWQGDIQDIIEKAALTMNLGMTAAQDRLAQQLEAPTDRQRAVIEAHASRSADMLVACGIQDPIWLQAVREHHARIPGPLTGRTPGQQLARLIQRADMFAARLSPRATRSPLPPAAAMQACYFDEKKGVDQAGSALIKAIGLYPPGTFVRLASNEVAIVVQRGTNTKTPRAAVLLNRSGMATVTPLVRDTSAAEYKVTASVPQKDVKVTVNLNQLLPLTVSITPGPKKPW